MSDILGPPTEGVGTPPEPEQAPPIVNELDRVIMCGEDWVKELIHDVAWSETRNIELFETDFEVVSGHHMADPKESFYQGVEFMSLIRRKSDGRLFGYPRWEPVAKHAEAPDVEPNGDDHGLESTWNDDYTDYVTGPFWVWLPVEPFTITGYRIRPTGGA